MIDQIIKAGITDGMCVRPTMGAASLAKASASARSSTF